MSGLRFFTVYGPWGRPDMAYYKFASKIMNNETIDVYNNGDMKRDFTYVDDIISGMTNILDKQLNKKDSFSNKYNIFNIGNSNPVDLMDFIGLLEQELEMKAKINFLPMQQGDLHKTWADIEKLKTETEYEPKIPLEVGMKKFVDWFKEYHRINVNN